MNDNDYIAPELPEEGTDGAEVAVKEEAETPIKVGGRTFKNLDEVDKSYSELLADRQRLAQERSQAGGNSQGQNNAPSYNQPMQPSPDDIAKQQAVDALRSLGFVQQNEVTRVVALNKLNSDVESYIKEWNKNSESKDLQISDEQKEQIRDLHIIRGLPLDVAMKSIKADDLIRDAEAKARNFKGKEVSSGQSTIRTRQSEVEEPQIKPEDFTRKNLKDNVRRFINNGLE